MNVCICNALKKWIKFWVRVFTFFIALGMVQYVWRNANGAEWQKVAIRARNLVAVCNFR